MSLQYKARDADDSLMDVLTPHKGGHATYT